MVVNEIFSGSFCEAGLKKLATALFVVEVVTFRFAAGGDIDLSCAAGFGRFSDMIAMAAHCSCRTIVADRSASRQSLKINVLMRSALGKRAFQADALLSGNRHEATCARA